jgi:hypothetical protein
VVPMSQPGTSLPNKAQFPLTFHHIPRLIEMSDLGATRPLLGHKHEAKPITTIINTVNWNSMWPYGVLDNASFYKDFREPCTYQTNTSCLCKISGSHGGEYEDTSLLVCVSTIAFMMEAVSTSGQSLNVYQTTRRNNPENSHLHNLFYVWCLNGINLYTM